MMKNLKIIFFFAFLLIFSNHSQGSLIEIKVQIENEIITNKDIESESKYLLFLNPKLKELDTSKVNEIAKNTLITEIIKKKELEKYFDFTEENNLIDVLEESLIIRKNIKDKNEFKKILEDKKINYSLIRRKLKIETFWNQLVFKKYSKNILIDEEELKQNIISQFNNKEQKFNYNLSEIIFSESVNDGLENKLLKIIKSINEIGFENTANIYSISNTSSDGGLIGWINELQISNQINKNIKNLKINQVSKPIKISNGYILIKVNDKKKLEQKMNLEKELKKLINKEKNRQLNTFSTIFFKRLKKNIDINEY
ncbi:MAG: SurA [Euryarchaeota archaeon]|nr:SurA [Euryarchaeota archaeon]